MTHASWSRGPHTGGGRSADFFDFDTGRQQGRVLNSDLTLTPLALLWNLTLTPLALLCDLRDARNGGDRFDDVICPIPPITWPGGGSSPYRSWTVGRTTTGDVAACCRNVTTQLVMRGEAHKQRFFNWRQRCGSNSLGFAKQSSSV